MSTQSDQPTGPGRDRKGIPRWVKLLGIVVVVVVLVLLVMMTMLGRSGHKPPAGPAPGRDSSATSDSSAAPDDSGLAFAECMRKEGIDMPDPSGKNGLRDAFHAVMDKYEREELDAALQACQDLLPQDAGR